ncbi:hypothetical protein ACIRRH_36755 [Kitasatospora sp. NPDC101235]|uniref:hypothetical protein n=1 Tax=Kitasatospora sp. NPDC101235 TaxID=3364101 RepID=UPI003819A141
MPAADMLASSDEIHTYLVARLNDALRRPGMWGGELGIRLMLDHLLFLERRQEAWDDEQRPWSSARRGPRPV